MDKPKKLYSLWLPRDLLRQLEQQARIERRTASNMIRLCIEETLDRHKRAGITSLRNLVREPE